MPTTTAAAELRFRAMGCDVHVVVDGPRQLLQLARDRVEELERRWSRFRPDSEISRLNLLAGSPVQVSPVTLGLVRRALQGARATDGRYDPTVLGDVLRAGYDRSFEQLAGHDPGAGSSLGRGWAEIVVDPAGSAITLPAGVGLDPGGIGKGYAADLLVAELRVAGAAGVCVNLGGDLRVDGHPPGGGSWVVAIEHPLRPGPVATVTIDRGAVATSSRMRRAWGPAGNRRHHLIDPATGRPAASGLAAVTVLAAEGWQAEVLAKAAFLGGLGQGPALLAAVGADGLLVDDHCGLHHTSGFGRFTAGPPGNALQEVAG